ncbi:hypothetical protein [Kaarinaea lacus]
MTLTVVIEGNTYAINVPENVLTEGQSFFEKMDKDMDKGWMMSREWVEKPDQVQRCQIAADRIADSINTENETLTYLMAGYILTRMGNVKEVHIDTDGEMTETQFITS